MAVGGASAGVSAVAAGALSPAAGGSDESEDLDLQPVPTRAPSRTAIRMGCRARFMVAHGAADRLRCQDARTNPSAEERCDTKPHGPVAGRPADGRRAFPTLPHPPGVSHARPPSSMLGEQVRRSWPWPPARRGAGRPRTRRRCRCSGPPPLGVVTVVGAVAPEEVGALEREHADAVLLDVGFPRRPGFATDLNFVVMTGLATRVSQPASPPIGIFRFSFSLSGITLNRASQSATSSSHACSVCCFCLHLGLGGISVASFALSMMGLKRPGSPGTGAAGCPCCAGLASSQDVFHAPRSPFLESHLSALQS